MENDLNRVMAQIREGMDVVDAQGEKVGTVDEVRMGDPEAATLEGEAVDDRDAGLFGVFDLGDDNRVTDRMLQRGYLKIGGAGLFEGDKYVLSDDLASVEGESVHLRNRKDDIRDPA
jgi:sporulation protein YlmC with PRC-barrel domain